MYMYLTAPYHSQKRPASSYSYFFPLLIVRFIIVKLLNNIVVKSVSMLLISMSTAYADIQVGVAWAGKSGMADRVLSGVQERLVEVAPEIKLDIQGSLANIDELHKVASGFQSGDKKGMIILRSNGSVYLSKHSPSIPTFIGGNNHPVQLGSVDNMESPGGNVTGVTYYVPIDNALESFTSLAPQVSSFLLISQANYSSSAIDWNGTKTACDEMEFQCAQVEVSTRDGVIASVKENVDKYDAFIMGNQSAAFDNTDAAIIAAAGKPVFSYAEKGVLLGALGGVIADDKKLGRMLADSMIDVLIKGKAIKDVGVKMDPEPTLLINMTTAQKLEIEPPAELLSIARII